MFSRRHCVTIQSAPKTCTLGTNELLGTDPKAIAPAMKILFDNTWKKGTIPPLRDEKTGGRIVETLLKLPLKSINSASTSGQRYHVRSKKYVSIFRNMGLRYVLFRGGL